MKIRLCALLLLTSSLLFSQAPSQSAVSPKIKRAQQLNSEGKQDEALAILNQLLAGDPNNYEANLMAVIVLDLKGDYAKAHAYIPKAIDLAPPDRRVQALRTAAVSYAFPCDLAQVVVYEQQAFDAQMKDQKFSDAAGTANEMARIALECGDTPGATEVVPDGIPDRNALTQPFRGGS